MASLTNLATDTLALRGAGTTYNIINRFFATKAEADAALADNSWAPVAGRLNATLTGDQGLLVYNENTQALDLADQATRAYVDAQLAALTGDAPALLNTLGEISDALNDDPNFFTTAATARAVNATAIATETTRATAAEAAIQADVDQNESDADAAIAAEATARAAAVAAVQADVDQNESDADAAIAAVQADVDQNEADADAAIATETAARAADVASLNTSLALKAPLAGPVFTGVPAGPTTSVGTNTGQLATTAFVAAEIASVVDGAPGAINTLNELAAALGDDANFSTTVTNLINANETHIDNVATLLGIAKDGLNFGTFSGSTLGDNLTLKTVLQALETAVEARSNLTGGNIFSGEQTLRDKLSIDPGDGGLHLQINRNVSSTQMDILLRDPPSGARLNLNTVNANADDALVVYSTKFWCRALGGGTGSADFDGNVNIDGSLTLGGTAITATGAELNYVDGVTSNIQTQLNAIQADVDQNESDADTAIGLRALIADTVLTGTTEAKGVLNIGNDGLNSGYYLKIQRNGNTQLDLLARNIPSGGNLNITNSNGNNARVVVYSDEFWVRNLGGTSGNGTAKFDGNVTFGASIILDGTTVTATGAELNHVDGVTSNIQTQLDAKLEAETITLTAFKAVVAASSDFADFQTRVAAL